MNKGDFGLIGKWVFLYPSFFQAFVWGFEEGKIKAKVFFETCQGIKVRNRFLDVECVAGIVEGDNLRKVQEIFAPFI